MPVFELYQPASIDDAIKLLDRHGADAMVLAGGLDSMDWLKDRLRKPKAVVDLGQIKELRGVKELNGGVEIGAMTPLAEVVKHPVVREKFSLLMEAAELVASPQIRNQGTIGGNVSQDTRCWYYRGGWTCYRAGGNICYADTPTAVNREHAIFDADRCVAVNPSDTAPALVALDASMVIRGPKGERVVPAEEYWIGPGIDITRMNILQQGELLTAIRIPSTMAGAQFYFEKVRDRQVWDFALVNVAFSAAVIQPRVAPSLIAARMPLAVALMVKVSVTDVMFPAASVALTTIEWAPAVRESMSTMPPLDEIVRDSTVAFDEITPLVASLAVQVSASGAPTS